MKRAIPLTLALGLFVVAAGCGGDSTTTTPTTTTAGPTTTDTFAGVVQVGSIAVQNFTETTAGTVNITLVSAGPPSTIQMGLALGTPGSTPGTCSFTTSSETVTPAGPTAQLSGPINAGLYCVEVLDIGNAAGPITFTVTIAHS